MVDCTNIPDEIAESVFRVDEDSDFLCILSNAVPDYTSSH